MNNENFNINDLCNCKLKYGIIMKDKYLKGGNIEG